MIHLHGTQAVAFRVLILDGEAIQRDILARCVQMLGWTADTAASPDEALTKYAARPHDTIVIDLTLGQPDTRRLLRHLRGGPSVIFVSEAGDQAHAAAAREARDLGLRVAGTLARPVDPYSLHAMLLANPAGGRGDQGHAAGSPSARDLDQALRNGEIHTEYQAKTDLATGAFAGVEALARWRSPTFGLISPDRFVPVAEQSDLISRLTFQVLADAIKACRRWRKARPNCSVAVNLSPHVLADPGLAPMVDQLLSEHELPAGALIAEVTEMALLSNLPAAANVLTRLSQKGVRVSIDDFGTGYSSVLSLLRMPFAELKIDRSFIGACRTDPEAWKLVRATISMARELEMHVVAKGIETAAVSDRLRDTGCDTGQGWYFGRPMQEAAMLRWLEPAGATNDARQSAQPSWRDLTRPPPRAGAATGGPDKPGHDGWGEDQFFPPGVVAPPSAPLATPELTMAQAALALQS
jgi:EAL domain-containing protein (putative c-di-GMP-specific phosphodiesterase class I)/ActR/RegA family two-component response regulator